METLLSVGPAVLLEVGPGQTLSRLAAANGASGERGRSVASLPGVHAETDELEFLLETLGRLWLWGVNVNWKGFTSAERRQRIVAPTYIFDRQRYWVEPAGAPQQRAAQRAEVAEWFWRPVWRRAAG
jgi:acyl transferase domain-containing protein